MSDTLTVTSDGKVVGLYTEAIDLTELGTLDISRASNVEFNIAMQEWLVIINGDCLFSNASRQICLDWEHMYFNEVL